MFEKSSTRSTTTNLPADDHIFHRGPRHGPVSQALNDNKLDRTNNFVAVLGDAQMVALVVDNPGQYNPRNLNASWHAGDVTLS